MRPLEFPLTSVPPVVAGTDSTSGMSTKQNRLRMGLAILCVGLVGVVAWLVVVQ